MLRILTWLCNLRDLFARPAQMPPRKRSSTHLTPRYEKRRTRELRTARLKFEAGIQSPTPRAEAQPKEGAQ